MSITKGFEKREVDLIRRCKPAKMYASPDVDALLAHTRALEAMLKKHERVKADIDGEDICWDYCPECREYFPNGMGIHKSDCQLAKLLEGIA